MISTYTANKIIIIALTEKDKRVGTQTDAEIVLLALTVF